jgi:hypothetical protein
MAEPIRESLDDFITSDEAATILGRSPKTLCDWRWKGIGPGFINIGGKRGGAVLYRRADVLEFKAQRDAGATMSQIGGAQ